MNKAEVKQACLEAIDLYVVEKYMPHYEVNLSTFRFNDLSQGFILTASDIAYALKANKLSEEVIDDIKNEISKSEYADEFNRQLNWNKMIRDAEIRLDFASALRNVKRGWELSGPLGYGFSSDDISELAKLHKVGKFRRKIEELLEDCNFHEECGNFADKKYEKYI